MVIWRPALAHRLGYSLDGICRGVNIDDLGGGVHRRVWFVVGRPIRGRTGIHPGVGWWYESFVPVAERLYDEHIAALKREGLLDG